MVLAFALKNLVVLILAEIALTETKFSLNRRVEFKSMWLTREVDRFHLVVGIVREFISEGHHRMKQDANAAICLATEFRLRRWARVHYVPSDQRKETWNPIVLNEMRVKDQEMHEIEESRMKDRVSSMYVPLAPETTNRIDEAHAIVSSPHILKMRNSETHFNQVRANQAVNE